MDLRELRYFESAFEHESISAAAKHCFVSQPSISAAIQNLEHHLGEQLFVRHTRGVTPTDAGHRLYPLSQQLTGQARSIKQLFQQKASIKPFRLGVVPALGASRMSHLIKEVIDSVDGLELTLVDAEKLACEARIISPNQVKPNEHFIPFWQDQFLMALPPGHSLSYKSELELSDLQGLNFILRGPSLVTRTLLRAMEPLAIKMNTRARVRTVEYAVELVAAGVGAALVPNHPSFFNTKQLTLLPIKDMKFDRVIGLAYSKEAEIDNTLASVIEICKVNKKD
jgi:LysR family transcriptional regulator, benzoate and cis,cis-muconate-responsive activator of ben and cat genes